jgi:hypothetical protein
VSASPFRRPTPIDVAFFHLQGGLLRRRLAGVESVLRLELAGVALLLGGYVFLQVRPVLEDLATRFGAWGVALGLEAAGLGLAALGAWLVAARHRRRLRAPEGPTWMALPIEAKNVASHLAWESKLEILWVALPALAIAAAATGLLAVPWHLLLAAGMAGFLLMAADLGAGIGEQLAAEAAAPRPALSRPLRILTDVAPPRSRPRLPRARFRRVPAWRALLAKDALVASRLPELRTGLVAALALAAISLLGWLLPAAPPAPGLAEAAGGAARGLDLRNLATFFVTLGAAAMFAEWLVLLIGSDPFATLRTLPLGVRAVWTARAAWAVGFTLLLLAGHALLARGLEPGAHLLFLSWVAGATLGLALLGVNFGLSLWPHTAAARRLLGLTLLVMAIVSTVLFLVGWVVLLAAIVHTAFRLPRWTRATEA